MAIPGLTLTPAPGSGYVAPLIVNVSFPASINSLYYSFDSFNTYYDITASKQIPMPSAGTYTVSLFATDTVGNFYSDVVTYSLVAIAPAIEVIGWISTNTFSPTTPKPTINVTGAPGAVGNVRWNGGLIGSFSGSAITWTGDLNMVKGVNELAFQMTSPATLNVAVNRTRATIDMSADGPPAEVNCAITGLEVSALSYSSLAEAIKNKAAFANLPFQPETGKALANLKAYYGT